MKKNIFFFDATLRDGSHAIKHQLSEETIERYCQGVDDSGIYAVIVGHGNGLGASSLQVGVSKHPDGKMLSVAKKNLKKTKLGIYMIPGFGTIKDNLIPAIDLGVEVFKIGTHCTEADTTKEHIEFLSNKNHEVYGILMLCHMANPQRLLEEALKMQSYGADGVILMDSAGALLPDDVKLRVEAIVDGTNVKVGFHAHNNMNMATANTIEALKSGATIVDGTTRGFGAGAGNCQLEVILAILQKMGVPTGVALYNILDLSDNIIANEIGYKGGISPLNIISGLSGVFSAFDEKVKKAAEQFNLDARDIFIELGKRNVVAGQEDLIVDVATHMYQKQQKDNASYILESLL
jgi:4-hydroxy 2-oxovalerate aldolase